MVSNEQILNVIQKLKETKSANVFRKVSNDLESGFKFMMLYLMDTNQEVYASSLSAVMNISRTRVGILLNKLQTKGYIEKIASKNDARIEVVRLTDSGYERCKEMKEEVVKNISYTIQKVGYNEINQFLETANKIKNALIEIGYID